MLGCYTDRLSVRPGERFSLYASATHGPCRLEITRIGAADIVVATIDEVADAEQPIPPNVDRDGCGWSQTLELEVGETWVSGYYDIKLVDAQGATELPRASKLALARRLIQEIAGRMAP